MRISRLVPLAVLSVLTLSAWAGQNKLAGILVGMSPAQVKARLGEPSGILTAQPPVIPNNSYLSNSAREQMDGNLPTIFEKLPAIMVFRTKKNGKWTEYEVDNGVAPLTSVAPSDAAVGKLPVWAYPIRVGYLGLDQQEYIYRVNSTYSLGIVFTGEGAETRVTDIIAASTQPFTNTLYGSKVVKSSTKLDMLYKPRKLDLSAASALGVSLGASYSRMLVKHGWPDVLVPFVGGIAADYKIASRTDPIPDITPMSGKGVGAETPGSDPVRIYSPDGESPTMESGFARNFEVRYVKAGVGFTVIDMEVVRLHIGQGIARELPKPPVGDGAGSTSKPAIAPGPTGSSPRPTPTMPPTSMPPRPGGTPGGYYPPGVPPGGYPGGMPGGYPGGMPGGYPGGAMPPGYPGAGPR